MRTSRYNIISFQVIIFGFYNNSSHKRLDIIQGYRPMLLVQRAEHQISWVDANLYEAPQCIVERLLCMQLGYEFAFSWQSNLLCVFSPHSSPFPQRIN